MIRSLTIGLPLDSLSTAELAEGVAELLACSAAAFARHAVEPRTRRFTLPACGQEGEAEGALLSRLRWVDELARQNGVRWFCLPLDFVAEGPRRGRVQAALDGIVRFERLFLNMILAADRRIAIHASRDAARLVLDVSRKGANGFDNFRVGASMNCPANAPFFPFSRHEGPGIAFSFALETARPVLDALRASPARRDAGAARDLVVATLTPLLRHLDGVGREIAAASGAEYRGLDASFAPLPVDQVSVAALIEEILGAPVGGSGTVFATAFLTDALRTAIVESGARGAGFNGVMFSVLEDPGLAASNDRRRISVDNLLATAAVCACGLDMVPIPGLSFPEEVAAVMLDVAAYSCALDKPLGVRLLPIPSAHVGDFTRFSLDFLCDSRVIALASHDKYLESAEDPLGLRTPRH